MNIGLLVAIGIIVLLIGIICWLMYMAVVFTNKHNATASELRKAKLKIRDLQGIVYELQHQLANAKKEVEKWKDKSVEISINAQKNIKGRKNNGKK